MYQLVIMQTPDGDARSPGISAKLRVHHAVMASSHDGSVTQVSAPTHERVECTALHRAHSARGGVLETVRAFYDPGLWGIRASG